MIGALVVTHGHLAQELVAAAEMIVGEISHIHAVSIGWHDDVNETRNEIDRRIGEVDVGSGVLVMTDMFGGTPSNIAFAFHEPGKTDIVTGVNLPMIIKVATQSEGETLGSLVQSVLEQGHSSIRSASEFLQA